MLPRRLHRVAEGRLPAAQLAANLTRSRSLTMCVDGSKLLRPTLAGGVLCMDVDHVERRFLLVGSADAGIAIYDTEAMSCGSVGGDSQALLSAPPGSNPEDQLLPPQPPSLPPSRGAEPVVHITRASTSSHRFSVSAAAWYPVDSGLFLTGSFDNAVKVWDANAATAVATLPLASRVYALSMSAAPGLHSLAAVGTGSRGALLCDVSAGAVAQTLVGHRAGVWAAAWDPCRDWQLVTGSTDGQLLLWDVRRAGPLAAFDMQRTRRRAAGGEEGPSGIGRGGEERCLNSSTGGRALSLVAGGQPPPRRRRTEDGMSATWSASEGDASADTPTVHAPSEAPSTALAGASSRAAARPSPLPASTSAAVGLLQQRDIERAVAHQGAVTGVLATPDGGSWLSAGTDDSVRRWGAEDRCNLLVNFGGTHNHATKARRMALDAAGRLLFYPTGSSVAVYDVETGEREGLLQGGHFESINCCVYNERSEELYTAGNDCRVVVWSPARSPGGDPYEDEDRDDWSD